MATSKAHIRKGRVACDRCYELKERCARTSTDADCPRCNRLRLVCATIRPVKPAGRRPQRRKQLLSGTPASSQSSSTEHALPSESSWLRDIPNLSLEERELLMYLLGSPENFDCYVVSSSFQAHGQRSLAAPLPAAWPVLKDAYIACARALKLLQTGVSTELDKEITLRHASSAMMTLQSLPVTTLEDATLCLTLGTVLALFVYSAVGVGVADICQYSLSTTRPFLDAAESDTDATSSRSFLVMLELMDCVVHRRKLTLRIQSRTLDNIDRHLGLCLPLLPHYHDLCEISHSLRASAGTVKMATFRITAQFPIQIKDRCFIRL